MGAVWKAAVVCNETSLSLYFVELLNLFCSSETHLNLGDSQAFAVEKRNESLLANLKTLIQIFVAKLICSRESQIDQGLRRNRSLEHRKMEDGECV